MKLSVGLKQRTSLSLTPQLQQAIRLLQLSSLELAEEIQSQLDSNPLLDVDDAEHSSTLSTPEPSGTRDSSEEPVLDAEQRQVDDQMQATNVGEDLPVDVQWDDIYSSQSSSESNSDFEEREDNNTASPTLAAHLAWQLDVSQFSSIDHLIAVFILDAVDERGFLTASLDELYLALQLQLMRMDIDYDIDRDELDVVLKRIQNFDPAGVAARDLPECLALQLAALPQDTRYLSEAKLLLRHHQYLLQNDITGLMRQTKLSQPVLQSAMTLLKSLSTAPGNKFQDNDKDYQIPDVIVQKKNNAWHVQLNPDILPRLRVHPYYASLIEKGASQGEDKAYLSQHLQGAKQFIRSVDERHKTLLRVSQCIVQHQKSFFELGLQAMKPLVLREIADELELHESTISRVTTQKYMLSPRGLFELKYFFSSHVSTSTGGECSSTAIRAMIKDMIDNEDRKKPLSDQVLADQLQQSGIDVARRTVAKYRESLNISSSGDRKRLL